MSSFNNDKHFYKDYSDPDFNKILEKQEFISNNANLKKQYLYQEPHQMLLRNFISKHTIYNNILLYNELGSGKTCSSITIAEGFKEYVNNMGNKMFVLIKNKNIEQNFKNELLSKCTGDEYTENNKTINKYYQFVTYGTFVNRVLGAKEFEKDEFGKNLNKVKKINGVIQRKRAKDEIKNLNNTVIIVDEAHNVTNNDIYIALYKVLSQSYNYRLILLTATPMYDNPKEIFEISNLLNSNDVELQLPIRNDLFKDPNPFLIKTQSEYINSNVLKGGIITITDLGKEALRKSLFGKVSYLKANIETNPMKIMSGAELLPKRVGTTNIVYCQMSDYQYRIYLQALSMDVKTDSKYDISTAIQNIESVENTQEILIASKSSSLYKNSSDASTMTYLNGEFGKEGFLKIFDKTKSGYKIKDQYKSVLTDKLKQYSNKLFKLLENIKKNETGNIFIYSNYVSYGGTSLVKQVLLNNGFVEYKSRRGVESHYLSFIVFDESTSSEMREAYRRIFNSPENKDGKIIRIIIGSPIISEGITLKGVRQVHILEPSWNMSRINQIIGRAVRNYSHFYLEPNERNVEIYKYVSVHYKNKDDYLKSDNLALFFIDREKYILAEEKDRSNKIIERLLKEHSFDCELNKSRNMTITGIKGSAECDYQECNYNCVVIPSKQEPTIDKSTYDMYLTFFDQFDIYYALDVIKKLFKEFFIYKKTKKLGYLLD